MTFCHVCWKNKGYELGSFSRLRMPDAFSFFCMSTEFHQPHVFETNRKQTTCTNQFSMCLSRRQFQCRNSSRKFFCSGMSEDIHQEMRALPRIFHLKAQHEPSLVQIRVKATGQETSSDFVVSFGSLEQKLELERDGLCV